MFSNLKTVNEFIELKKKSKGDILRKSFLRNSLSIEFDPLFLLLESILQIKITEVNLFIFKNKIKGDRYGISFTCNSTLKTQVLENLLVKEDYELKNNIFTFYLD